MPLNRRNVLKQLVLVSAGAAILPSCLNDRSKASLILKNFSIDSNKEKLLEDLTSALIPSGPAPGARDIAAHLFLLRMVDDCMSKDDRDKFLNGLGLLEKQARSARDMPALLSALDGKNLPNADLDNCYKTIKKYTIQAYTTSKYYLTRVQVYELVPGRFHGCVPVKTSMTIAS